MKNDIVWVTYFKNGKEKYKIKSDEKRAIYRLYDDKNKILKKNENPLKLEDFLIKEKLL